MFKTAWRALVWLCAFLGALLLVVTFTPLVDWWAATLANPWSDSKGDVLIVLTGSVIDGGTIGDSSYWRSVYAVRTWREGGFQELVISGDRGSSDPMREFIVSQGVPTAAIRTEDRSISTRENALYTSAMLRDTPERKVLLTSDYHMFRAFRAFRKAGLEVLPRPIPDARKRATRRLYRWWVFLDLCTESMKIVYYKARGWI
jgi:uncharacterized SAM-binding protein YcdF (DUF218 family)